MTWKKPLFSTLLVVLIALAGYSVGSLVEEELNAPTATASATASVTLAPQNESLSKAFPRIFLSSNANMSAVKIIDAENISIVWLSWNPRGDSFGLDAVQSMDLALLRHNDTLSYAHAYGALDAGSPLSASRGNETRSLVSIAVTLPEAARVVVFDAEGAWTWHTGTLSWLPVEAQADGSVLVR